MQPEDADRRLIDEAVDQLQHPVLVENFLLHRLEQELVPHELLPRDAAKSECPILSGSVPAQRLFLLDLDILADELRHAEVVLERSGEVVGVGEVEVRAEIDVHKHLQIFRFQRIRRLRSFVGNLVDRRVLDGVDGVVTDESNLVPLGDQNQVITFEELHEADDAVRRQRFCELQRRNNFADFLCVVLIGIFVNL